MRINYSRFLIKKLLVFTRKYPDHIIVLSFEGSLKNSILSDENKGAEKSTLRNLKEVIDKSDTTKSTSLFTIKPIAPVQVCLCSFQIPN